MKVKIILSPHEESNLSGRRLFIRCLILAVGLLLIGACIGHIISSPPENHGGMIDKPRGHAVRITPDGISGAGVGDQLYAN
jgi:hypothetical protein